MYLQSLITSGSSLCLDKFSLPRRVHQGGLQLSMLSVLGVAVQRHSASQVTPACLCRELEMS